MVTKISLLFGGVLPYFINGNTFTLPCLESHWPGVQHVNSTHLRVSWSKGEGSGFVNCDDSPKDICFVAYKIILNGKIVRKHEPAGCIKTHSDIIKADPCFKHDVSIKLRVVNEAQAIGKTRETKIAHYNNVNEHCFDQGKDDEDDHIQLASSGGSLGKGGIIKYLGVLQDTARAPRHCVTGAVVTHDVMYP